MTHPKVTLGVTTYNVERYLPLAFDAVLAQDFTDFEVVVCDNRSTDRTWEICQQYAAKDDRFRVYQNDENIGMSANFARVVSLARAEYFRLTSHDDLVEPALLSRCVAVLDAHPEVVVAYPASDIIDGDGRFVCTWDEGIDLRHPRPARRLARHAKRARMLPEQFGVLRTEALRKTGLLGSYLSSDMRLTVELVLQGEFEKVPETLFHQRVHASSTYGADRSGEEVIKHLEPGMDISARKAAKRARPGADYRILFADTIRAILRSDLPLWTRLSSAAAWGTAWQIRRTRVRLGRYRRRLTRRPVPAPPWETRGAV